MLKNLIKIISFVLLLAMLATSVASVLCPSVGGLTTTGYGT